MYTVNDFADAVIRHEYGPFSGDNMGHMGLTRPGHERTQRHLPFVFSRPSHPVTFGHVGWDERHHRQQHHVGHGFFPAGFDTGVFMPPGHCLAPWECEPSDIGHEMNPDWMAEAPYLRHPYYIPFSAGAECAKGDPLCDVTTGGVLGSVHGGLRV